VVFYFILKITHVTFIYLFFN